MYIDCNNNTNVFSAELFKPISKVQTNSDTPAVTFLGVFDPLLNFNNHLKTKFLIRCSQCASLAPQNVFYLVKHLFLRSALSRTAAQGKIDQLMFHQLQFVGCLC